jgi:hypothetical protein
MARAEELDDPNPGLRWQCFDREVGFAARGSMKFLGGIVTSGVLPVHGAFISIDADTGNVLKADNNGRPAPMDHHDLVVPVEFTVAIQVAEGYALTRRSDRS